MNNAASSLDAPFCPGALGRTAEAAAPLVEIVKVL